MKILFKNIAQLIQIRDQSVRMVRGAQMNNLPTIRMAYLVVENGRIAKFGPSEEVPQDDYHQIVDVSGKMVMPTWVDSHTHIVYTGNREDEFVDRINGHTYQEIADKGGGILNSAKQLEKVSEEQLYIESETRLQEVIKMGTGAIEIKSGYGLTLESELKMLRVIRRLKESFSIPIKATFLGAHAVPSKYKDDKADYIKLITDKMIPAIAAEQLADFIDVFCEKGYFELADTQTILKCGHEYGLTPKIHVNQFNAIGGVQVGVENQALSVDHLEVVEDVDIEFLQKSNTMPVALPGCSYFLGIPYTPARRIIDAGLPLALASDYNPGSAPSGNMNFVVSTACVKMKLTPEEAINAATINAAYAMGIEEDVGSITIGKRANFIVTKPIPSYGFIPYSFGASSIDTVYIDGQELM